MHKHVFKHLSLIISQTVKSIFELRTFRLHSHTENPVFTMFDFLPRLLDPDLPF